MDLKKLLKPNIGKIIFTLVAYGLIKVLFTGIGGMVCPTGTIAYYTILGHTGTCLAQGEAVVYNIIDNLFLIAATYLISCGLLKNK
ncbi:MAG: hypothetical protein NUV57_02125 [archaeon]|nr:hypothetical protein [archaeon]